MVKNTVNPPPAPGSIQSILGVLIFELNGIRDKLNTRDPVALELTLGCIELGAGAILTHIRNYRDGLKKNEETL